MQKRLGKAVQRHQVVAPGGVAKQRVRRRRGRTCGQEIAIGLVDQQPESAPLAQRKDVAQQWRRVDRAGRVVGRDQHQRPHRRRERRFDGGQFGHEALRGVAVDGDAADAEHGQRRLVVEIERAQQGDLLAGADQRQDRGGESLIAAGGDVHVAGIHIAAVQRVEIARVGRTQGRFALDRPVARAGCRAGGLGQGGQHAWMRWVTRHRLRQIDQRPVARVIGLRPALDQRDRRRGKRRHEGIEMRHVRGGRGVHAGRPGWCRADYSVGTCRRMRSPRRWRRLGRAEYFVPAAREARRRRQNRRSTSADHEHPRRQTGGLARKVRQRPRRRDIRRALQGGGRAHLLRRRHAHGALCRRGHAARCAAHAVGPGRPGVRRAAGGLDRRADGSGRDQPARARASARARCATIERIGPYNHVLGCAPVFDLRVADVGDVPIAQPLPTSSNAMPTSRRYFRKVVDAGRRARWRSVAIIRSRTRSSRRSAHAGPVG